MGSEIFSDIFNESVFFNTVNFSSEDDIFNILDALGCAFDYNNQLHESLQSGLVSKDREESEEKTISGLKKTPYSPSIQESETEVEASSSSSNKCKRQKLEEGQQKISHITVERNRRKLMNEHLSVLRSLMPCFYVKRGDQASIIGGVINYINELQQILHSLKAKKQIRATNESLSPKPSPPHPSQLSPCKPPLSLQPISPSTPQPSSPYKPPRLHQQQNNYLNSPSLTSPIVLSPCNSPTSSINDSVNELVATSKSAIAEVEVKFSGPNLLLLKTMSHRIPGQAGRIISSLEELELEILDAKINTVDETMINFFTVKIGIECQLSAEELALQILQTFH